MNGAAPADRRGDVSRRLALFAAPAAVLALAGAASATPSKGQSWAKAQIAQVVGAGLMGTDVADFHPDDPLTQQALHDLVEAFDARLAPAEDAPDSAAATATTWPLFHYTATTPSAPVTVQVFDHVLVNALGLSDAAAKVLAGLRRAGLHPPARAGSETIARLIGLRFNHPAGQDDLELLPTQPITRAEAAYSAARALTLDPGAHDYVESAAASFQLPVLTDWQRRILTTAVSYVGFPYVWGGTDPGPEAPAGVEAVGGFDCSGFVWRVYKLTPYPDEGTLASAIAGRTTFEMAREATRAMRILKPENLEPGDVLLFGNGPKSKASQVDHAGIYLGGGWFVHSSDEGVALAPLGGWWASAFAFARRPLREAGLES
jgi:cell wall-associated NlpC family hydrolase